MSAINHESILREGRYRDLSIQGIDNEVVLGLYKFMMRLRRCEQALSAEYHPSDEMRCPAHFCVGQEAVPAALSLILEPHDHMFSHHRSHGYFLAKHAPMKSLFAELYGRETGANGGKAGSQDISMPSVNFYSGAILAGAVAIAVGVGLGFQLQNNPSIAVAGFGEAASEEGIFWEAINYAAQRKLPVIFVCENNCYSVYSHLLKRNLSDNLSDRVEAFGVKSHSVFGNDVIAVHSAITTAASYARMNQAPFFVEAYTYRWNAHVGPEDDDHLDYRPRSELEFWKANCPIALLEEAMFVGRLLSADLKKAIIEEIDAEIDEAFRFAKSSSAPIVTDWEGMNYSTTASLADELDHEVKSSEFDQHQEEAIPGPY